MASTGLVICRLDAAAAKGNLCTSAMGDLYTRAPGTLGSAKAIGPVGPNGGRTANMTVEGRGGTTPLKLGLIRLEAMVNEGLCGDTT